MSLLRGAELKRLERMMAIAGEVLDEAPEEITPFANAHAEYVEYVRRCEAEGLASAQDATEFRERVGAFGDWQAAQGPAVTMAYVITAACGHTRAVIVDEGPGSAEEAATFALQGMTVERRPIKDAPGPSGGCSLCQPEMAGLFE